MATGTAYRAELLQAFQSWSLRRDNYPYDRGFLNDGRGRLAYPTPLSFDSAYPPASRAAWRAIWESLTLDPVPAGPSTYYQNCYSTASGAATIVRMTSKSFAATGTGSVTATQSLVTAVIQQCYAAGSAAVTLVKQVTKGLSASATGSPALVKAVSKTFSATGTGAASLTKKVGKVLTTTGAGAVAMTKRISKVFATTGTGSVSYSDALILVRQLLANAVGTVTASQTFIAAPPVQAWFAKLRRTLFRYIRRR